MSRRNTKQKEKILNIMNQPNNMIHPTINEVIKMITEKDSTIGQATIYRNINKLVEDGELIKIPTQNGYHYDINTKIHGHLICSKCHKIYDLFDDNYQSIVDKLKTKNIIANNITITIDGICCNCNENKK